MINEQRVWNIKKKRKGLFGDKEICTFKCLSEKKTSTEFKLFS